MLNEQQLATRRAGIGGSDVAPILGLSPWASPLDVFLAKKGRAPDKAETPAMRWGSLLEPVILREFSAQSGIEVITGLDTMQSLAHPFMLANLDGATKDGEIVEAKTARTADGWGDPGGSEVPPYYWTQVQHYMAVTDARLAWLPVLIGGSDFRIYSVPRDAAFIADMIEAERAFWHNHVVADVPPEPVSAADALKLWPRSIEGKVAEATPDVLAMVERLRALRGDAKALDTEIDSVDADVRAAFGDAETLVFAGKPLGTFKTQTARRVDTRALEAAHPELVAQFRNESTSRVLRLR